MYSFRAIPKTLITLSRPSNGRILNGLWAYVIILFLYVFVMNQYNNLDHSRFASTNFPPHTIINMPALSPTMTQGNIGTWQKKIGDVIAPGDILVEIETDKAQMEFECQEDGFLAKILLADGSKDVLVGTPMAIMCEDEANITKFKDYTADQQTDAVSARPSEPEPEQAPKEHQSVGGHQPDAPINERTRISPVAKSMANDHQLDISQINGTGPNNRIVKSDIESALKQPKLSTTTAKPSAKKAPAAPVSSSAQYVDVPMTNMRKVIAARLTESKQSTPHYYVTSKLCMDRIIKLRQVLNATSHPDQKMKLSINDFVIKACAMALQENPKLNVSYMPEHQTIREYKTVDISVAVATETGLITPIVQNANRLGLASISSQVKSLAAKAKSNQLLPHEYTGGSFTISNLGMYGSVTHFTAIINPPQSAILAISGIQEELVRAPHQPDDGSINVHASQVMNVCLSSDHRVIDGAVAAQWMTSFKKLMEEPLLMLL